ncbi:MAG: hypothetical protein M3Z04_04675 [Chloroflexota bacterium]|nr:hypothetical protein [Chloroflexota bacterium]
MAKVRTCSTLPAALAAEFAADPATKTAAGLRTWLARYPRYTAAIIVAALHRAGAVRAAQQDARVKAVVAEVIRSHAAGRTGHPLDSIPDPPPAEEDPPWLRAVRVRVREVIRAAQDHADDPAWDLETLAEQAAHADLWGTPPNGEPSGSSGGGGSLPLS